MTASDLRTVRAGRAPGGSAASAVGQAATVSHFSNGLAPGLGVNGMILGPDGNIWFAHGDGESKIGRITPAGQVTEFNTVTPGANPRSLTVGPDGNLWVTLENAGKIARISTTGVVEEKNILTAGGRPDGIVNGGNGFIYFTIPNQRKIGVMLASPPFTAGEFTPPSRPGRAVPDRARPRRRPSGSRT